MTTKKTNINNKFKFLDLCAGIWAWHEALVEIWWECIWFSEIEPKAEKTYRLLHNCSSLKNYWDLMKIDTRELPNFDVLIWGFPCQSFSIIWKRKWMIDERGQIIYGMAKILSEKKPNYFILENVKWLVNHDKGNTLKVILELLQTSWYNVSYKVLKSSDYNVPQIRERIYFVWMRKDLIDKRYEFPKTEKQRSKLKEYLIDNDSSLIFNQKNNWWNTFISYLNNKYNKWKYTIESLIKNDFVILDTRQSDLRLYPDACPTLRTWRHWLMYIKNWEIRKLSWYEALLLQWFPIDKAIKTKNISNTTLLSQAGNAFTVSVIKKIAQEIPNLITQ